ncbi:carboxyvinyl-carboxyphosphonate phosphorylmutase [Nitzschia inconspicua]|uniref:Carboxyvinyl-carboxyphosphonate phosphorylmutase n=1 Tax=Nitzschia inconspicua TaxID=303405 RepID=A0A9K3KDB1_9STRA|nr:carboxyvinyl-carboxyphosphonate phosphorylmutase [Nitzschia inconspicua]
MEMIMRMQEMQQQQQQRSRWRRLPNILFFLFMCNQMKQYPTCTFTATALSVAPPPSSASISSCPPPLVLQQLLDSELNGTRNSDKPILLPCCYDGLTARLVAKCGYFEATFLTGFGASAVHGMPDTQLLSYSEMQQQATIVAEALANVALEQRHYQNQQQQQQQQQQPTLPIPCIADGDTGYGNAINAKRTVFGYARANMAGIMIEDQVSPKRCGHVAGKCVVGFDEAVARVRAACDARDEYSSLYGTGTGPLILARTDALKTDGLEAALERCLAFQEAGCDMTFLEAPRSVEEMLEYCRRVPGPKLANMLEQGDTPILSPQELKQIGYTMAAYPLTLLSASIKAMTESLERIHQGLPTDEYIASFPETKDTVGFTQYAREEHRYKTD